jgi:hypothetical protein
VEFPMHWLIVLLVLSMTLGVLIPIAKILRRMGFRSIWCLLYFVPIGNLIGLWLIAYIPWPATEKRIS